jgi:tetratricopeptide (TPR) repeat protein
MKILIFPILFAFLLLVFYLFIHKSKKNKPARQLWLLVAIFIIVLIGFLGFKFLNSINIPDTQCTTSHVSNSLLPKSLITADDYFNQGNYDYDIGKCKQAIVDYSKAIQLNTNFPEAYNNRAYTYMRMQNYKNALPDLNKALKLRPDYIHALMNRGDLYNYYGPKINRQKAIADYNKVIALGGTHGTSVCGHLFLAIHNGWNLGTILDFPRRVLNTCN